MPILTQIRLSSIRVAFVLALAAVASSPLQSQSPPSGAVTGRVYCADTNLPCRFANVILQLADTTASHRGGTSFSATSALDGSFTIEHVAPGQYYILAELPGYTSSVAGLPPEELRTASAELRGNLDRILQKVAVEPGQTASVDIRLERGAAISGQVLYDDGSPGANLSIHLLRRQKDATWKTASADSKGPFEWLHFDQFTDDRGHYRETGLPAGEYVVEASLPPVSTSPSGLFGNVSLTVHTNSQGALKVYSGNSTHLRDATPVSVSAGEERTGVDITIPLSGLHRISGNASARSDGHAVPRGQVSLLDPDDKSTLRTTTLQSDGTFYFDYVPDGSYLVQLKDATDIEDNKVTHRYQASEQPLLVQSDVSGITFSLTEQNASR